MNLATTEITELLPHEAAERLQALKRERDDASAIVRAVVSQAMEERSKLADARQRLAVMTQSSRPLPDGHPSVVQARRTIDACNSELARLGNRETTAAASFNHNAHIVTAIERWALGHTSAGRGFALAPKIEPQLLKGEGVLDGISRTRQEIRRLEADLHAARSAPLLASEARAAMVAQISALAEIGRPHVSPAIEHGEPIEFATTMMQTVARGETVAHVGWEEFAALPTFAYLFKDTLIKKLASEIDAEADDTAALSKSDRKRKEAELLVDISTTRRQTMALIALAEEQGIAVEIDSDCPPDILLGVIVTETPSAQPAGVDHAAEARRVTEALIEATTPIVAS